MKPQDQDQKQIPSYWKRWKSGDFNRDLVPEIFHTFMPAHATNTLQDIDLNLLWSGGKRLILLDVDHTLVKWKAEDFAPEVIDWIERAKTMGFELCIISNTRRVQRLERLRQKLGVETVRGRFKPSRAMFRLALIKFKRTQKEAVMIGDQLMTDILGANRAGIDAIWVRRMEGKEFKGTMINRFMERIVQSVIYKGLIIPMDHQAEGDESSRPLKERSIVQQFVKFVIVGGSSFIIDAGLRWSLTFHAFIGGKPLSNVLGNFLHESVGFYARLFETPEKAAISIFFAIGACFGILNSFVWNRLWTFEIRGKEERMSQFRRFFLVSIIGLLLNVLISSFLFNIIPGHRQMSLMVSTIIAAGIVAFWNFTGQRLYAFRPRNK